MKLATCLLDVNAADEDCRVLTTGRSAQPRFLFNTVFLDPGEKAFQTFYSPEGLCGTIGEGFAETMYQMAKSHDKLYRESSGRGVSHTDQQHMRMRCQLIRVRLRHMIQDLHEQTISFLCNHFNHVFIPPYATTATAYRIAEEDSSSIFSHKMALSIHHDFWQKLKTTAQDNGTRVYMIGEEFTTKTCGCCGHIQTVGSQRVFNCQQCDLTIDRDLNAARNICLKTLSLLM
jgi:putative transposase